VTASCLTINDVYKIMDWNAQRLRHSCRPAVNYYLISNSGPKQRAVHQRAQPCKYSERSTYSVIPRHVGGETGQ
jgi:NAD(P)H-nitrite reductase large subunit